MVEANLVMAIDIGSTAIKVIVMDGRGQAVASVTGHYPTSSPRPGWLEQEPETWWAAAVTAVRSCLAQTAASSIRAVSFSGHMSAPVLLDREGKPIMPSILIADTRSVRETDYLRGHYREYFLGMTGNEPLDAFTVSKLLWIKNHRSEAMKRAAVLLFPKDYIRYKLSGHLGTDPTDAGNSLLYDPVRRGWSIELIKELGLAPGIFPNIYDSHELVGCVNQEAAVLTGLLEGTPIVAGAADMACSQLGTGAARPGVMAVTLSTSAQVVMRVDAPSAAAAGRATFHPSSLPGTMYAMGSVFTGGLGVDWCYRLLTGKAELSAEDYEAIGALSEKMVDIEPGSSGLMFLPFLVGSGTPHFDPKDRASWLGLSTGQSPELLLHSVMEGIAYNIRDSMELFESEGHRIEAVHLGGGGSRSRVWNRMLGDVLGKDISLLGIRDASAMGAAILAAVGSGLYKTAEEAVQQMVSIASPEPFSFEKHESYERMYARYQKVYRALNEFYNYKD